MAQYEMLKKLAIGLAVVIVLLIFANVYVIVADIPGQDRGAGEVDPMLGRQTSALHIGDTVTGPSWQYTVVETRRTETADWAGSQGRHPTSGTWQLVHITAANVSDEPQAIDPLDFELRDAAGHGYAPEGGCLVLGDDGVPRQPGEQLSPGVMVKVILAFDVEPQTSGLSLYLAQANQSVDLGG